VVRVAAAVGLQLAVGVANVWLLAPIWLQLVHLLLADLVWISLVLLTAAALAPGEVRADHAPDAGLAPARS
jgi:heme a synthase